MASIEILELYRKPGIYIKTAGDKGRGVFCKAAIKQGEIIETTPVLIEPDVTAIKDSIFLHYVFKVLKLSGAAQAWARVQDLDKARGLVLGVSSLCNHKATPNATYTKIEQQGHMFFTLSAQEDIPADKEICIDYGTTWFASRRE